MVLLLDGEGKVVGKDKSEGAFTILGSLDVVSPEKGDLVYGGTSRAVVWDTYTAAEVDKAVIKYTVNGGKKWKIAGKTQGDPGIFYWDVPDVLEEEKARLKIFLKNKKGKTIAKDTGEGFFRILPRP
jgi:hypothetical protein